MSEHRPRPARAALAAVAAAAALAAGCAGNGQDPAAPGPRPGIPTRDATLSAPCAAAAEGIRALATAHANSFELDATGAEQLTAALADVRRECTADEQRRLLDAELGAWLGQSTTVP